MSDTIRILRRSANIDVTVPRAFAEHLRKEDLVHKCDLENCGWHPNSGRVEHVRQRLAPFTGGGDDD